MKTTKNTTSNWLTNVTRAAAVLALLMVQQNTIADGAGKTDTEEGGANSCMQDVAGFGLQCTANDIEIAGIAQDDMGVDLITILDDGCTSPDDTITFTATFEVLLTAQARHDIGLWFATDGDPNFDGAVSGECTVGTPPYGLAANGWLDLDGTGDTFLDTNIVSDIQDTCGDIDADNSPIFPVMTVTAACEPGEDGNLSLPNCTSWKQPGDNDLCTSPLPEEDIGGPGLDSSGVPPGAPSKCNCDEGFTVPIPVPAFITVDKVALDSDGVEIPADTTSFDFSITGDVLQDDFSLSAGGGIHTSPPIDIIDTNGDPVDGGPYAVTESVPPAGWVYVSASCTRDNATPDDNGDDTTFDYTNGADISPDPIGGEIIACTFTNQQNIGTLTLVKTVTNDNGGTATEDDFQAYMDTTAVDWDQTVELEAGTNVTALEDVAAGYSAGDWGGDCAADGTVTIEQGVDKVCTITNDDIAPSLTLIKEVSNANGGDAVVSDWTLAAAGPTGFSGASGVSRGAAESFDAGTYDLSESGGPVPYTASDWVCVGGSQDDGDTVTIGLDDDVTCTITNTDIAPTLKLVKTVTNDDGGDNVPNDWTLSATATSPSSPARNFSNAGGSGVFETVFSNVGYDLGETGPDGYTPGSWSCDGGSLSGSIVTLSEGETEVTCTIDNDDQPPTLKLVKNVVNTSGGNNGANDWNLSATAAAPNDGRNFSNLGGMGMFETVFSNAGYDLSESVVAGYLMSGSWSCNGGSLDGSIVTLTEGETGVTCTVTNTDVAPTLKLVKTVTNDDGGEAVPDNWTLTAAAAAPNDGANFNNAGGSGMFETVLSNVGYDLSESDVAGYTNGSWSCDGGSLVGSTVTLVEGQTGVTCTINNDDIKPTLKLVKKVENDDGGTAAPDAWTLSATAAAPDDGRNFSNAGGSGVFEDVFANAGYNLGETAEAGYTNGSWSCDGGALVGTVVTLGLDDDVTCEITNADDTPQLKLVKTVTNDDGGNAVPDDWNLTATAATPNDGRNMSNAGGSGAFQNVFANASYDLGEMGPGGYTPGDWSCVGGGTQVGSTITLGLGDQVTCTIDNDDQPPTLKLVKNVVNTSGGNNGANDWNLSATAAAPNDGRNFSNLGGMGMFETVFSNAGYDLSESVVAGYLMSGSWSCNGGSLDGSIVTLTEGETGVTCTVTNTDVAPTLKLVKTVTNDDGGEAVPDNWTLTAAAAAPNDGANFNNAGGSGMFETVLSNVGYDLSESDVAGYTNGSWSCDGGSLVGSTVTLVEGQTGVTCTINNDDIKPTLKLVKKVENDDGGTAAPDAWTLSATAAAPDDGRNFSNAGGSGVFEDVFANAGYNLGETAEAGYTNGSWSCDGGALVGTVVTLGLDDDVTCEITNADDTPQLKLVKTVTNDDGGNAVPDDWNLTATAATPNDGRNMSNAGGSGAFQNVFANASYDLGEMGPGGYTPGDWSCVGGGTQVGSTITLGLGDQVTCTINNDDIKPKLTLIKNVINDNGGNADPDDFSLTVGGISVLSGATNEYLANTSLALNETQLTGYTFVDITGDAKCPALLGGTVTLDEGDDVTCTITNDDVAPKLTLIKSVINDDGGTAKPDDFKLTVGGAGVLSGATNMYSSNIALALNETQLSGYSFVSIAGDQKCAAVLGGTVTLDEGDDVTCTITNDDIKPTLKLVKKVNNNDGGDTLPDAWTLSATAADPDGGRNFSNAGGSGVFEDVFANAGYDLGESNVDGYTNGTWSCNGGTLFGTVVTLGLDDDVTCEITNEDDTPQLKLVKTVTNNNGGNNGPNDWNLTASAQLPNNPDRDFNNAGAVGVLTDVYANVGYDLKETGPDGYTAGAWSCVGGTQVGSTITLDLGEQVVCTINNDDIAPELTLIKNVINDDGGMATPNNFNLTVGGNGVVSGATNTYLANTALALNETLLSGYTFVSITGSAKCPALLGGSVTLDEGEKVTCTITNDDVAPTLKLLKTVDNGDGGTAVPDNWTLSAAAASPKDGRNFGNAGGSGNFETVFSNIGYDLSETTFAGYTNGTWSCDGGSLIGSTVTLSEGQTGVTCTIDNDDIAPTLKLVKMVDNGANDTVTNVPDDFTLFADASAPNDGRNFQDAGGSGAFETVFANAGYDLSEMSPDGYQVKTDWSCDGGTQSGSTITLGLDADVTCTINNEALGQVTLKKLTQGIDDPTMTWNFTLAGPGVSESDSSPPTTVDFGGVYLIPGEEYTMCETGIPGSWTTIWQADTNGDGIPDTMIPHVPNTNDDPVDPATGYSRVYDPNWVAFPGQYTNDTKCVNFVVGVGEELAFEINNTFPGGDPRTIGFWKNWNSCTNGNQVNTATENGGPDAGWFVLDDLLENPGYDFGDPDKGGINSKNGHVLLGADDCDLAVQLLDKRDFDGRKRASDAAYNMAAQLLAAELNLSAGAETCMAVLDAVDAAEQLLFDIKFDGFGGDLKGKKYQADAAIANDLAYTLDQYNNGNLCSP